MSRLVAWALRHGRLLGLLALLISVPATIRTAQLYLHLRSDLEELLPKDAPAAVAVKELRVRMNGLQYLGVVADVGPHGNVATADRLIDDLALRVRSYPKDMVHSVRTGDGEERRFVERNAGLYLDLADLQAIRERIEARRDWEVANATDMALEPSEPPSLDFRDIEAKAGARLPPTGRRTGERFSSRELGVSLLLIEVGGFSSGADKGTLLERVKTDLRELRPDTYSSGMRIGFTGDIAISVEELAALVADVSLSSVLVLLAVGIAIILFYRWWPSAIALGLPLLFATVTSFFIASLPPFGLTELNSNTAFLGSIIVGNGINFGIVLLARYMEERRQGVALPEALKVAAQSAKGATLVAAVAAGVSYASLALTRFRGFQQFGIIGGIGMLVSWGTAFLLMPPLIAWLDARVPVRLEAQRKRGPWLAPVARFVGRAPALICVVGTLATFGAAWTVKGFSMDQLEHDFGKLRRADTWTVGEGYWGGRMDELLGQYLSPVVILADSEAGASAIHERLARAAAPKGPLHARVAEVRGIDDLVPAQQADKIRELERIHEVFSPRIRELVPPDKRELCDRLLGAGPPKALGLSDLPAAFTTALRERDGSYGKAVLVYPRPSKALWQGPAIVSFVADLRRAAATEHDSRPGRVAGALPISADILSSIEHDGPIATAAALFGVVMTVLLLFRFRAISWIVVGALVVGVLWLAAAALVLHVKINFANFIAFPITFGIGVDYAVNVIGRYVQDKQRGILSALRETGSAVVLCSLTTIIGYSSLLLAENRALFLFGLLAVLGEIACLLAAVTLLPAAFVLFERRQARALAVAEPVP